MGWVYVLKNKNVPGLLKIGFTDTSVKRRIDEVSDNAGVPGKYSLITKFELKGAQSIERIIHKELKEYRVDAKKEFFNLPEKIGVVIVRLIVEREELRIKGLANGLNINTAKDLGFAIKSSRRKKHLTQHDLRDKSGVQQKTISHVESGKSTILFSTILKILKSAGLNLVIYEK